MNRRPGTGVTRRQSVSAGSSAASSSRISACSGSVSWNSSTKMCVKRDWKPRRTAALSADQIARLQEQVEEVERAGARLQLLVRCDRAGSSCCRAAARSASASSGTRRAAMRKRVERLDDCGARHALTVSGPAAVTRPGEVSIPRQIDQPRFPRRRRSASDVPRPCLPAGAESPGSSAAPARCRDTARRSRTTASR